ncbi:hypothetical protein ADJ70_08500 [Olsenella sp. oral taxon 807]|uniref:TadE/TadG family type IV pilus assembly protein n=1 Tax=Olsenella sp. oral taxon 807 TaxID=712411 RepID=UPI000679F6E5|nr:TadE/TadG family type IV pilus assembly protein [Olsenella sp. oral taxon 807]AKT48968.1 hypothetical protein ADJ70_08500 [Olsenella sp. oral taxon 807]
MRRLRFLRSVIAEEDGQEIVEFALIVTLLIVLLAVPIDIFRYVNTRMILNDAATDAVSSLNNDSIEHNTCESDVLKSVQKSYGSRLTDVKVDKINVQSIETKDPYTYHVFNSDKQNKTQYSDQFDPRDSNYYYKEVSLTLSCTENAITPFGGMFFGGSMSWTIKSDPVTCNVYTAGYKK